MAEQELDDADLDFPEVNLKALYDYSYQDDDGHMVNMKQGEEYLLLQKYDDWWEVIRKDADTNELSFFVPSNYVEIISDEKDSADSSVKLTTNSGSDLNNASSSEGTQGLNKDDSYKNKIQGNDENVNKSMAAGPQNFEPEPDYENTEDFIVQNAESNKNSAGKLQHSFSDEGDYVNLDKYREESGISTQSSGDADQKENSGDGLYANLESLQSSQPPLPEYGEYIKTLLEVWDMYIHPETKRTFYVNKETHERTYKPPRHPNKSLQAEELDRKMRLRPKQVPAVKIQRKSDSLPDGWVVEESGDETFYINQSNNEKWCKSVLKENGKTYYYKVGGNETVWELPKIVTEPRSNGDVSSPDDNMPELESSNKVSRAISPKFQDRLKTRSMYLESHLSFHPPSAAGPLIPKSSTLPANMLSLDNSNDRPQQPIVVGHQLAQQEPLVGTLKVKKVLESNKKVKKTWNTSYVVLAKTNIIFYKDKKASSSQPGSPHGKPDFIVPLQDAKIDKISKDSSNKKTVVRVSTRTGDQYVLQNDDEKTLLIWFMQLELAVADLGSSGMESNLKLVRSTSQDDTKSEPKRKPSFKLFGNKPSMDGVGFMKSYISSDIRNFDHGIIDMVRKSPKVIRRVFHSRNASTSSSPGDDNSLERRKRGDIWDKLSNFVARRPSKDVLEQKGIIKDAVFGSHLKQVCDKDKTKVPRFVTRAIEAIEKRGLDHDGMYRVSGNLATVQKLRCQVDQDNYNLDSEEWEIHALTGCLKLFFRELREPLFPFIYFDKFVRAMSCPQSSDRLKAMKELVSTLPKCNYETMKTLFIHLLKVIDNSKENRMQVHNIAIVFGPTLIWPEKETPNLAANMIYQSRIVEFLLLEFKHIFKS